MLLQDLFENSVRQGRDRVAVDVPPGDGRALRQTTTYGELAAMAANVARRLRPFVDRECVVAVLLPRDSALLYAAQLGVLQAGAAHACFDPSFPDAHLEFLLRDAGAVAVLTDRQGALRTAATGVPALVIDDVLIDEVLIDEVSGDPPAPPTPRPAWLGERSLAYVIYTSGTTGRSKGVLIEHRGAVSLIASGVARFQLGPGDRCAQGSSCAYDSSVEETWLAFASGAVLVVLDDATVRLGPDLVPWLRCERVTVFCPPPTLLRAMDCAEPARALPELRLCYVGGEAMPQDLADRWGAALWLENGYGPTECTITVVRGRLRPGEPVVIGTPVPGHDALLLDEAGSEVGAGEVGELCLRGIGLARGYLAEPELTTQRFPEHPRHGRIYRTGDLARRLPDGRLVCLGRRDAQVKVRGHRIELEAVEAALAQCDGVREAACRVQDVGGVPLLAAFLVADDPAAPPAAAAVERRLRLELPDAMVPARLHFVRELPRTVGGKLDRRALPDPVPDGRADGRGAAATNGTAAHGGGSARERIAAAFAGCLGLRTVGERDDFFELGGDSLRAAQLVSRLRAFADTAPLAVRDVYDGRSVAALAARALARARAPAPVGRVQRAVPRAGRGRPLLATAVHLGWLLLTLAVGSGAGYMLGFALLPRLVARLGVLGVLLLSPLFGALLLAAYALAALAFAVLAKTMLIGRYRPGRAPVWTSLHVRHWLCVRAARLVPWGLLQGTALHAAALRALGARIGARVHIHRGVDLARGGWDLLTIGDDAVLGREAHLDLAELDDGELALGPVVLGARSVLDVRAGVGCAAVVGDGAHIGPLAHVAAGARVPAGERWDGVPARCVGPAPAPPAVAAGEREWSPAAFAAVVLGGRLLAAPLSALPGLAIAALLVGLCGVTADDCVQWMWGDGPLSRPPWTIAVLASAVVGLPLSLLAEALLLRWTRAVPAGTAPQRSATALRALLRTEIVEAAGNWLAGSLFWPAWLRLAGARVGRTCEISTVLDVLPEHLSIGDECFLADGIYLGPPRLQEGTATFAATRIGARTFVGNHAVVPGGAQLADDLLLGVATVADAANMPAGSAWFGLPAMRLPRREIVAMDRRLTHEPGPLRYGNRLFWETLRFLLPAWPLCLGLWWFDAVGRARSAGPAAWWLGTAVLTTLLCVAALALTVLGTKWLLLGRVRPGRHALWSCWASRWDFHYVLWQRYGRALLAQLEQTLLLPWFLRAMGMRIGRGVVLGDGFAQVVDPDMLALGDGATVHALFQAHSFEDRVLKIDRVHIGAGATVGRGAVVLLGAVVGDRAHVAPHAVVMKQEHLLPDRAYEGAPVVEVAGAGPRQAPR